MFFFCSVLRRPPVFCAQERPCRLRDLGFIPSILLQQRQEKNTTNDRVWNTMLHMGHVTPLLQKHVGIPADHGFGTLVVCRFHRKHQKLRPVSPTAGYRSPSLSNPMTGTGDGDRWMGMDVCVSLQWPGHALDFTSPQQQQRWQTATYSKEELFPQFGLSRGQGCYSIFMPNFPFSSHGYAFSQKLEHESEHEADFELLELMSICRLHIKQHFRVSAIFHSFISVRSEGCVALQRCIYCTLVFSVYSFTDECTWNASVDEDQREVWSDTPLAQPRLRGQRHDGKGKMNRCQ